MAFARSLRTSARRRLGAAAFAFCSLQFACVAQVPAQVRCGDASLDGFADRLRALEAQHPANPDDAVRRARDLAAVVNDPALTGAVAQACPGDTSATQVRVLAHQRLLVLWAKMLALDAVDMPVFPQPYDRRCANVDGATWQLAFIRAYVERLDPQGTDVARPVLRAALEQDAAYAHVKELVAARAQRLRIGALPTAASDEAAWLQENELARSKAQAALTPGVRCGAVAGVLPSV